MHNPNSPTYVKETEYVVKILSIKKTPGPVSMINSTKYMRKKQYQFS